MSKPIKEQQLFYHLTSLANVESILQSGLLARSQIKKFKDIADSEIIDVRKKLGLIDYVPFHFFHNNPFAGVVQKAYRRVEFVFIAVRRATAKESGWKIITKHPASCNPFRLYSYNDGFAAIDWKLMEQRSFQDQDSKVVCMAECLAFNKVDVSDFAFIFTKTEESQKSIAVLADRLCGEGVVQIVTSPDKFI
jgi:hypothetical protein